MTPAAFTTPLSSSAPRPVRLLMMGSATALPAGIATGGTFLISAAGLLVATFLLWRLAARRHRLAFHETVLEILPSGRQLAYADVTYAGFPAFPGDVPERKVGVADLRIEAPGLLLRVPRRRGLDRMRVLDWVVDRSRLRESSPPVRLPAGMADVYAQECERHGAEEVRAYAGNTDRRDEGARPGVVLGVLVTGTVILLALRPDSAGTLGPALLSFGVFSIFILSLTGGLRARLRKLRASAGIVLSPSGMTLDLPPLRGRIAWTEVLELKPVGNGSPLAAGLRVVVDGGNMLIGDHFSCPLREIHRQIEAFRTPSATGSSADADADRSPGE